MGILPAASFHSDTANKYTKHRQRVIIFKNVYYPVRWLLTVHTPLFRCKICFFSGVKNESEIESEVCSLTLEELQEIDHPSYGLGWQGKCFRRKQIKHVGKCVLARA